MLNLAQFKAKHAKKFRGMSDQDVRSRYKDYLNSAGRSSKSVERNRPQRAIVQYKGVRSPSQASFTVPMLSKCSVHYLRALTDPFDIFSELPCIPDLICLPSYKFSTRVRGTMVIGTTGTGWIAMAPNTPTNDSVNPNIAFTNGSFALNNFVIPSTGVTTAQNDSPFSGSQVGNKEFRLVGGGVRARYQGSEFQRGGNVILYRNPTNTAISNGTTDFVLLQDRTATSGVATRKWECVTYRPDSPDQLGYRQVSTNAYTMIIFITGAQPGQTWTFEAYSYWEAIGAQLQNATASHGDPVGMAAVQTALSSEPISTDPPKTQFNRALGKATNALVDSTSGWRTFANSVGKGLAGTVGNMIGGAAGSAAMQGLYQLTTGLGGMNDGIALLKDKQSVRVDEID